MLLPDIYIMNTVNGVAVTSCSQYCGMLKSIRAWPPVGTFQTPLLYCWWIYLTQYTFNKLLPRLLFRSSVSECEQCNQWLVLKMLTFSQFSICYDLKICSNPMCFCQVLFFCLGMVHQNADSSLPVVGWWKWLTSTKK